MPELPEVETVRRGLVPAMEGRAILSARANRPDLRFPFPENFSARLTGTRVERLDPRVQVRSRGEPPACPEDGSRRPRRERGASTRRRRRVPPVRQ